MIPDIAAEAGTDMRRCQEAKGCCQAWEKPGRDPGTGHQAECQFSQPNSRAGGGLGAESHHFGPRAALPPKPESELSPEEGGGAETKGDFSGLRVGPS